MNITLNYALVYGSTLQEVLAAKLTSFYNKILLKQPTRMIFLLPLHSELHRADFHKAMFDEIVVAKFDPTKASFWNTKSLYKFVCFLNMSNSLESSNCFIDQGKIFQPFEIPEGADLVIAQTMDNVEHMRYVNKQLAEHCEMPELDDSDLVMFDFSFCYVSEDLQNDFRRNLKQIIQTYPDHIDTLTVYAIMSCVYHRLNKNKTYRLESLEQNPEDINFSPMLEDFYSLV